jgi:hypothetical protein
MKTSTKLAVIVSFLFANALAAFSQLQPLPGDPGIPVPLDGGVLLALLAGGGIAVTLFKKNKKK